MEIIPPILPPIRIVSYDGMAFNLCADMEPVKGEDPELYVQPRHSSGRRNVIGLAVGALRMLKEIQGCDLGDDISVIFAIERNEPEKDGQVNWVMHGDIFPAASISALNDVDTWRDFVRQLPTQPEGDTGQPKWSIAINFVNYEGTPPPNGD